MLNQYKFQMKNIEKNESKKKQKTTLAKVTSTGTLFKKNQPKKTSATKKQEQTSSTKSKTTAYHSSNNSNPKTTAGSTTGVRSSKFVQQSLRTSPKSSLAEINAINIKKVSYEKKKKTEISKTPSQDSDPSANRVKEEVKQSLANVIKVYHPEKKSYLDVSMTEVTSDGQIKQEKIARNDFSFLSIAGEGGYGKVWKVEHLKTRVHYAMKQMSKALIIMKKSVDNVLNEMKILSKLKNPFISNMICAFHDRDNLYLGMDYLPGGDLRSFLAEAQRLSEEEAKFLIACIIKALDYIHSNKIFHRDIKPQNLVLDEKGYLRLTDFGIARSQKQKNSLDASGTPGYMAPQVICKQLHSYSVDFYAVGIICHELMMGKRPYYGQNRTEIRDAILSKQHLIKKKDIPAGWSFEAGDFVNRLIQRQPASRLGHKSGVSQLMQHPWFANYPWKQLSEKAIKSPIKQKYHGPVATDRMEEYDETVNKYKLLQKAEQKVDIFGGYFFNFR